MELTKEYFEERLIVERGYFESHLETVLDERFTELATMIAKGFAETATKKELYEVRDELRDELRTEFRSEVGVLRSELRALEHRLMSYIDKVVGRVDQKLDMLIRILGAKHIVSPVEVERIRAMGL